MGKWSRKAALGELTYFSTRDVIDDAKRMVHFSDVTSSVSMVMLKIPQLPITSDILAVLRWKRLRCPQRGFNLIQRQLYLSRNHGVKISCVL